jgi:hypothetical protein
MINTDCKLKIVKARKTMMAEDFLFVSLFERSQSKAKQLCFLLEQLNACSSHFLAASTSQQPEKN